MEREQNEPRPQTAAIAFIGAGNMALSLIQGLLKQGIAPASIRAADPDANQLERFAESGIQTSTNNHAALDGADVVVLAVKPQLARKVLQPLPLTSSQLLVSIAAGISLTSLTSWTADTQPIVRCMPNTPALVGAGVTALHANKHCKAAQKQLAERILRACGSAVWVDQEEQLDAVTAVSGSGPAYFFYLMEAMIEAGTDLGLTQELATELTLQTAYGAALMARDSKDEPATLRKNVTSPGGTTQAALEVMSSHQMATIIKTALAAAAARSKSLAVEFGAEEISS